MEKIEHFSFNPFPGVILEGKFKVIYDKSEQTDLHKNLHVEAEISLTYLEVEDE